MLCVKERFALVFMLLHSMVMKNNQLFDWMNCEGNGPEIG